MKKQKVICITGSIVFAIAVLLAIVVLAVANFNQRSVYSTSSVNIVANVETDGNLRVVDQRNVTLKSGAQNIQIPISKTTDKSFIQVSSVRIIDPADNEGESEAQIFTLNRNTLNASEVDKIHFDPQAKISGDMTYFFDRDSSSIYISAGESLNVGENYVIEINYTIADSVYVYDDMAEIYWDWIPTWTNSKIGEAKLLMQMPASAAVLPQIGENLWAWDHGTNGQIDYAGEAAFRVSTSNLSSGQGSRIHILYTKYWMNNISRGSDMMASGARCDMALKEELKWGDGQNARLKNSNILNLSLLIVTFLGLAYVSISYGVNLRKFKKLTSSSNESVTYDEQVNFDDYIYKYQVALLLIASASIVCLIIGSFVMRAYIGCVGLVLLFLVCIASASASPFIHNSFRDKISK